MDSGWHPARGTAAVTFLRDVRSESPHPSSLTADLRRALPSPEQSCAAAAFLSRLSSSAGPCPPRAGAAPPPVLIPVVFLLLVLQIYLLPHLAHKVIILKLTK